MISWEPMGRNRLVSPDGRFDVFQSAADQQWVVLDWDYGLNRRFATEEEAKGWCVEQLGRKPFSQVGEAA